MHAAACSDQLLSFRIRVLWDATLCRWFWCFHDVSKGRGTFFFKDRPLKSKSITYLRNVGKIPTIRCHVPKDHILSNSAVETQNSKFFFILVYTINRLTFVRDWWCFLLCINRRYSFSFALYKCSCKLDMRRLAPVQSLPHVHASNRLRYLWVGSAVCHLLSNLYRAYTKEWCGFNSVHKRMVQF